MTEQSASTARKKPIKRFLDRLLGRASREGIMDVLQESENQHVITHDAHTMIENVLRVSTLTVHDAMVARSQMVVVSADQSPVDALPTLIESAHSRFPVVGETRDEILGILLAKDVLALLFKNKDNDPASYPKVRELVRPAIFIPESKPLDVLLKEFRTNRNHMAMVVDEYGGIAGLITIEDVLEQIVGDIADEHDIDQEAVIRAADDGEDDDAFVVNALTPIEEINKHFDSQLYDEDLTTIGGLVAKQFGHFPNVGDTIDIGPLYIKVLSSSHRRIESLRISRIQTGIDDATTA